MSILTAGKKMEGHGQYLRRGSSEGWSVPQLWQQQDRSEIPLEFGRCPCLDHLLAQKKGQYTASTMKGTI